MDRLPAAAVAALIVIARGHETKTSPREATIFRHARRLALEHGMEACEDGEKPCEEGEEVCEDGEEWLVELARRRGADEFDAISAELPEAAKERAASFRSGVANGPKR